MKLNLKIDAIKLRKQGFSIKDISKTLNISSSTASLWCRQIILTPKQKENISKRTGRKLAKFFKLVEKQKAARLKIKAKIQNRAEKEVGFLSKRDKLIAGIALYWAEGFKHQAEKRFGFCNSDPEMIKFMLIFLKDVFGVNLENISPRLTVNVNYKNKVSEITKFWSDCLNIPTGQFTKPFFQKTKQTKVYENQKGYHGVLRIHVRKSSKLLLVMRGYINGFKEGCSMS